MAVGKAKSGGPGGPKPRRWVFGTNVAVMVTIAAALLVVVNWLAQEEAVSADWSSTGVNSLSDRTKQLLSGINEPVWLTSFYTVTDVSKSQKKYLDRIQHLFRLYQRANSKIETKNVNLIKDKNKLSEVLKSLREKYQDESKQHAKVIEEAKTLARELAAAVEKDKTELQKVSEQDPVMRTDQTLRQICVRHFPQLADKLRDLPDDVDMHIDPNQVEIPRFDQATDQIKSEMNGVKKFLDEVVDWLRATARKPKLAKQTAALFEKLAAGYETKSKRIKTLTESIDSLPELELAQLAGQLKPRSILVETTKRAKVVPFSDIWERRQNAPFVSDSDQPENPEKIYVFRGEAAVSSALLQLTQEQRTAVVFVRYGGDSPIQGGWSPMGMGFTQPDYGIAAKRLREANFVVQDWDVASSPTMPTTDKKIKRRIFVVLRPSEPRPPNPRMGQMRPPPKRFSPDDAKTVMEAIGEDGRALILAGWARPQAPPNPMMPAPPAKYEWQDLIAKWGVRCDDQKPILNCEADRHAPDRWISPNTMLVSNESLVLQDHPVADAIGGLRLGLEGTAPLEVLEPLPQGVRVTPMIVTAESEDVWAVANVQRLVREYRSERSFAKYPEDMASPLTVAVACENDKGGKAIIISSFDFGIDRYCRPELVAAPGGNFRIAVVFPGNIELLLNSIFWLNDNENQIATGPSSGTVRLIKKIEPAKLKAWRWTVWAAWPAVALIVGTIICLVRRR